VKNLSKDKIKECNELKFIINLLYSEPMTIGRLKYYCNARHKRFFGYEMTFAVAETHIAFLEEMGMIERTKELLGTYDDCKVFDVFRIATENKKL
tara:strand:- start:2741 stop:3025 length:285 start_codon:yes stop_codon:yes gene_type:complete